MDPQHALCMQLDRQHLFSHTDPKPPSTTPPSEQRHCDSVIPAHRAHTDHCAAMSIMRRVAYATGMMIRETGQAMDRAGSLLQGKYAFVEQRKSHISVPISFAINSMYHGSNNLFAQSRAIAR